MLFWGQFFQIAVMTYVKQTRNIFEAKSNDSVFYWSASNKYFILLPEIHFFTSDENSISSCLESICTIYVKLN